MKNPLRYQLSEYDCGPTSMLNALAFLFEREDIPPEAVRNIMLYCLDCYGSDGVSGKSGTSCAAMMFLSNWLNGFGKIGRLHISTQYLSGPAVNFGQNSRLRDALRCGGAAVVRLDLEGAHYVLLTGIEGDEVSLFDPYAGGPVQPGVRVVSDHPAEYNRIVSVRNFEGNSLYALGPQAGREAVLLFNTETELNEDAIEYII